MYNPKLSKLAAILSGLVAVNAIPVILVARSSIPSSTPASVMSYRVASVLPSSLLSVSPPGIPSGVPSGVPSALPSSVLSGIPSGVPSGVPSALPSSLLSVIPARGPSGVPSGVPSALPSSVLSVIPAGGPSGVPSAPSSVPPTTIVIIPITPTTTVVPTPTWTIKVEVGNTQMNIGDADPSTFLDLMKGGCNANGCANTSPGFSYNGIDSSGRVISMSGNFGMVGNVNNNQVWVNDLVQAINVALLASITCSTDYAQKCNLKRESVGVALDCYYENIQQCSMANWAQATMYSDVNAQEGQVTMSGTSEDDFGFDCSTLLGSMSAAATGANLDPPVQGALALICVICSIATGSA